MKHYSLHIYRKHRYCTVYLEHRFERVLDGKVSALLIQTISERHQNCSSSLAANPNHELFFSTFELGSYCPAT